MAHTSRALYLLWRCLAPKLEIVSANCEPCAEQLTQVSPARQIVANNGGRSSAYISINHIIHTNEIKIVEFNYPNGPCKPFVTQSEWTWRLLGPVDGMRAEDAELK